MQREFSAGGVLVRRLRGAWHVAAIRPAGKPDGVWALPKGHIDPGEYPSCGRYQTGVIFIADVVTVRQLSRNDGDNQALD